MRTFLFILFFSFFSIHTICSQQLNQVDYTVMDYQDIFLRKPEKLAKKINKDFNTELEKARAIYSWIALNIEYDVEVYQKGTSKFSYTFKNKEERKI